jgi:hypothetical protein
VGDYAACIGTTGFDYNITMPDGAIIKQNGTFQAVQGIRFAEILDGQSNTLLIGEKHVPPAMIGTPPWDCGIYDGRNPVCNTRAAGPLFPIAASDDDLGWKFGSQHPALCQFVFADGSVHALYSSIDPVVLGLLAQRNDQQLIPSY